MAVGRRAARRPTPRAPRGSCRARPASLPQRVGDRLDDRLRACRRRCRTPPRRRAAPGPTAATCCRPGRSCRWGRATRCRCTSRSRVVRSVTASTVPVASPTSMMSPTPYWSSTSMKMPDRKSLTRLWAPKPMATPAMPAPAMSGPRFTPSSPRIIVTAIVQMSDAGDRRAAPGPASGPGPPTAATATRCRRWRPGPGACRLRSRSCARGSAILLVSRLIARRTSTLATNATARIEQDVGGGGQQLVGRLGPRLAVGPLEDPPADEGRVVAAGLLQGCGIGRLGQDHGRPTVARRVLSVTRSRFAGWGMRRASVGLLPPTKTFDPARAEGGRDGRTRHHDTAGPAAHERRGAAAAWW